MEANFKTTKKKLTIIFSIIIFLIAFCLELAFFSIKYFNEKRRFEVHFDTLTNEILEKILLSDKFIEDFNEQLPKSIIDNIKQSDISSHQMKFINFVILDENKKIVFYNFIEKFSLDIFNNINNQTTYRKSDFLVKKVFLKNSTIWKQIVFFKSETYSFSQYINDLLWFFSITWMFSIIFYYIWYLFVSISLRPVWENLKDMKEFVHNAGHELKTPISVIHSNLQLIKATKKYDPELIIESIEEINRLNSLIEALVDLSSMNRELQTENIDIAEEIKNIIKDFSSLIKAKNINISFIVNQNFILKANKDYFRIFLWNFLSNAIKYNKESWNIKIILQKNKAIISDNWIWIEKKDLNKIFERFFRAEKARKSNWFWIGLSLVKKISQIYSWKIKVKSELGKWTEIEVKF